MLTGTKKRRQLGLIAGGLATALTLAACGGTSGGNAAGGSPAEKPIVGIITKTDTNPFFVKMREGASKAADAEGVTLQAFAGKNDGDNESQVQAIENLISAGAKGFLIAASDSAAIVAATDRAKQAGLVVIALDTPLDPPDAADATYATDNFMAGEMIGKWAKAKFEKENKEPRIAFVDASPRQISVDVQRDQGFMSGFGIDPKDKTRIGDESDPRIVGHAVSEGEQDKGRTAMETLLQQDPNLNLVYTINEPAAAGAYEAIKAAGKEKDVTLVSVDGGCPGVEAVKAGQLGATSQQYPLKMAEDGVKAIAAYAKDGPKPTNASGDFTDTGVTLITDQPESGVDSKDTTFGAENCWG